MQRYTHITGNNLIRVSVPLQCICDNYGGGRYTDEYINQMFSCDVSVFLHSKISPLFMKHNYNNSLNAEIHPHHRKQSDPDIRPFTMYL